MRLDVLLTLLAVAVATTGWLALAQVAAPLGTDHGDLVLARFLNASGEAFLTGMLVAIFVAVRPGWLATCPIRLSVPRD